MSLRQRERKRGGGGTAAANDNEEKGLTFVDGTESEWRAQSSAWVVAREARVLVAAEGEKMSGKVEERSASGQE